MVVLSSQTWDDVGADPLSQIIEANWSFRNEMRPKFNIKLVEMIYNNEIFKTKKKFAIKKIMLLEFSQYLENYLWPNFSDSYDSIEYVMSIILMINEKSRQRVSSLKILENNIDVFPLLFDKLLHYVLNNKLNIVEKTQGIIFLNNAFNSLEIDFVRKCVQKLVSLTSWTSIMQDRREAEFFRVPKLRKLYNALMKKEKKFLDIPDGKPLYEKSIFDRTFMWNLLDNFKLDFLKYVNSAIQEFLKDPNKHPLDPEFYHYIRYGERFLEFLIDLEAHLPNRRFFKNVLDSSHFITHCTLSLLNLNKPRDLISSNDPKTIAIIDYKIFESYSPQFRVKAKLFGQLLEILKFYHDFEINDITGEALTEDEKTDLHYDKISSLQRICFRDFKDEPGLFKLALSHVGRIDSRKELIKMLKPLSCTLLVKLANKLNLVELNEEMVENSNKELLLEILISRHEKRTSQLQAINDLPLYPTEKVLWDQNLVPDDYYTGEDCLALPKLNLQFLTLHDYLLRNFRLFQLETMYEIRQDIQDALYRLKPWISENPDQIPVVFGGWARMAAPIDTLSIIDIGKPEIGDESARIKPSRVRADVTINLNVKEDVREEWLTLRKHDVCFLVSLKPNKPHGYKYKPPGITHISGPTGFHKRQRNEEQIMPESMDQNEDADEDESKPNRNLALEEYLKQEALFPNEYGIVHIRGCEIEGMLDVEGKIIEEGPRAKNHTLPPGVNRTWRVWLDTNQYALDIDIFAQQDEGGDIFSALTGTSGDSSTKEQEEKVTRFGDRVASDAPAEDEEEQKKLAGPWARFLQKKGKFSYDEMTFQVVVRRKPKENNFKAVLDTIRRIMNITQGRPGSLEETYASQPLRSDPQKAPTESKTGSVHPGNVIATDTKVSTNSSSTTTTPGINVCEEMVVPHWLHDLILGFGEPDSASYYKVFDIYKKKYPHMLGLDEEGFIDFRDTFLNRDHVIDSFPQALVEFVKPPPDLFNQLDNEKMIFYKIKFPNLVLEGNKDISNIKSTQSPDSKVVYVKEYPVTTFGPPRAKLILPRNIIKFTPTQVQAIKAGLLPGLTLVVGPPGTGKTDLAVQIAKLLYHSRPNERILVITHSNQALNQIFAKLAPSIPGSTSTCDEAHLLRLGHGETQLSTDKDFGKYGRVDHVLRERISLLEKVHRLRDSLYNIIRDEIPILNPYTLYDTETTLRDNKSSDDSMDKPKIKVKKSTEGTPLPKQTLVGDKDEEMEVEEDEEEEEKTEALNDEDKTVNVSEAVNQINADKVVENMDQDIDEKNRVAGDGSHARIEEYLRRKNEASSNKLSSDEKDVEIDYEDPDEVNRILTSIIQGKGLPPPSKGRKKVSELELATKYDFEEEAAKRSETADTQEFERLMDKESILTRDSIILESYRNLEPSHFSSSVPIDLKPPITQSLAQGEAGKGVKQSTRDEALLGTSNYYRSPEIHFTCETAVYFYRYEILSRWDNYQNGINKLKKKLANLEDVTERNDLLFTLSDRVVKDFPFSKFMARILNDIVKDPKAYNYELLLSCPPANESDTSIPQFDETNIFVTNNDLGNLSDDGNQKLIHDNASLYKKNLIIAENYYNYIKTIFDKLEEFRAFEVLMTGPERVNYLLIRSAHVIAMTCTHAALRRGDLVKLGFKYDTLIVEEAAQILEIESFIPLLLQNTKDNVNRLKRIVMIGDHNQLPPVIKNMAFKNFANMEQSLFTRLVRLGVPTYTLDAQGRAKPSLCKLYSWKYEKLGDLPHTFTLLEYLRSNPGFVYDFQLIDVQDFNGRGETTPTPHYYQNLGEAEYCVALYSYMRLIGYPAEKITILTTYNGQKHLIRDIIEKRCAPNPLLGKPAKVTTVDKYQGQQNDYIILSLVRTKGTVGHLRDVRRLIVAVSRARLGLYTFCRVNLFSRCLELTPVFKQLLAYPLKLNLLPTELYPGRRLVNGTDLDGKSIDYSSLKPLIINDVSEMSKFVYQFYNDKLKMARELAMAAHMHSRVETKVVPAEVVAIPEIELEMKRIESDPFAKMAEDKAPPIEYIEGAEDNIEEQISVMPLEAEAIPVNLDTELIKEKIEGAQEPHYYKSSLEAEIGMDESSSDEE